MDAPVLRVLGGVAVGGPDGGSRSLVGNTGALLGVLATERGRVVSFDHLVAQVWGDTPPASVRSTVYANVSRLRSALRGTGLTIEARPPGYVLAGPAAAVDAHRFTDLVAHADALAVDQDWPGVLRVTSQAHALWLGPPFEGALVRDHLENETTRLERLADRAEELAARALLRLGRAGEAAQRAEHLVRRDPFNENHWRLRMRAEHADGRTAAALRTYAEFRDLLDDQLGIDPGERMRALHLRILRDADRPDTGTAGPPAPAGPEPARGRAVVRPVARDRECRLVADALADALARTGRVVLLEGAAGVGKTRLAEYAADSAAQAGARVVWARAIAGPGTPALWLWESVLRELRGRARGMQLVSEEPDLPPEQARFRTWERIAAEVLTAADEQPLVLVLDDLQWADEGTLRTLLLLSQDLRGRRCLVVGTARPREPAGPDPLDVLARDRHVDRVRLDPFTVDEVRALVGSWPGPLDTDGDAAPELHDRTGGNAYLLTEILRDGGTRRVPASVAEIYDRRLAAISPEVRAVLELVAVAGRRIDPVVIARARGTTVSHVVRSLEPLRAEGLVVSDQATRTLAFVHDLGREAVAARVAPADRLDAHRRLARAIAEVHAADPRPQLDALADHRYRAAAGTPSVAAYEACMAAADQASAAHAHDRAAVHRARALEVLAPGAGHQDMRFEVLLDLATELRLAGDAVAAAAALAQAVEVARDLGDHVLLRRSLALLGEVTLWNWRQFGEVDEATVALLDDVVAHDATAGRSERMSPAERAEILGTLAVELYYGDDRDRGLALAAEGVEIARRTADPVLLGRTLNNVAIASWFPARAPQRRRALDEALALVDRGLPQVTEAVARLHRAPLRLQDGDVPGFLEDLTRAEWLAPRVGRPELTAQVSAQWTGYHALRGDLDAARAGLHDTDRILTRMSLWGGEWVRLASEASLARIEGTLSALTGRLVDRAGLDAHRTLRWTAALAVALDGDPRAARRLQARWALTALPRTSYWGSAWEWAQAAELALLTGAPGVAEADDRLGQLTSPLVLVGTAIAVWGPLDLLRARLAAERGDQAAAQRHRRAADAVTRRVRDGLGTEPVWPLART